MPRIKPILVLMLCLTAFAARAYAASVTLAWDANAESNLAGYVVTYGVQAGIYTGRVDAGLATTAQISGLADGTRYYFAVLAYNTNGEFSDPSAEVSTIVGSAPAMAVDTPADGASLDSRGFAIAGWALDQGAASDSGVDAIHVWAYPVSGAAPQFVAALSYGNPRADVGAVYGAQFTPSGFGMTVNNLAPGQYALAVYAHSTVAGTFNNSRVVHVTITPPASRPALSIDTPRAGAATQPLWFGGWAVDLGAPAGTGVDAVHVWAYPIGGGPAVFAGAAAPNLPRPDVGTVFGSQFTNSGYGFHASILAPGAYTLVAYARSTVAGAFNAWQSVQVTITNAPLVTIDTPAAGAVTQPASLAGWALDVGATSGTGADAVHVWAYPTGGGPAVFAGAATPNLPRPDVGAAFGSRFTNSGYRLVLNTLPVGSYTLVAYVRSTVTGAFTASPGVAITTGNAVVGGGGS